MSASRKGRHHRGWSASQSLPWEKGTVSGQERTCLTRRATGGRTCRVFTGLHLLHGRCSTLCACSRKERQQRAGQSWKAPL